MKKKQSILIIDDDKFVIGSLSEFLSGKGYDVITANDGKAGIDKFEDHHPLIVLLDQELPDLSGLEVCRKIMEVDTSVKIIFITAHASIRYAVDAMQSGAFNYIAKPFSLDELLIAVSLAEKNLQLEGKIKIQEYKHKQNQSSNQLIGSSPVMRELKKQIQLASESDSVVLITGETGVGKNLIARQIHQLQNSRETFLTINCSAIPENLIEAEYFGHEKGIFTGADTRREGIFELADGGTLVLDEIGDVPYHLQSKLLSVIEEKQVRRIGSARPLNIDVRIIAITNHNLEAAIRSNRFREDLYYRLAVVNIYIPALREHPEDIPEIGNFFAERFCGRSVEIAPNQWEQLKNYKWPGNARELRNIMERASLLRVGNEIRPADLLGSNHSSLTKNNCSVSPEKKDDGTIVPLEELMQNHIAKTLDTYSGNKSKTARALGISLSTLKRKIKQYKEISIMGQNDIRGSI